MLHFAAKWRLWMSSKHAGPDTRLRRPPRTAYSITSTPVDYTTEYGDKQENMLATIMWVLFCLASVFATIYTFITMFIRKPRPGEPPIVKGSLLLGSAADFGAHAVDFLHKCRENHGEIFTIRLINKYLTIIMDPHSAEAMHKERNFDFDPIHRQVNGNVFNFRLFDAEGMIRLVTRLSRGPSLVRLMESFHNNLQKTTDQIRQTVDSAAAATQDGWTTTGLSKFAGRTIFDAIFHTVFGRQVDGKESTFNAQSVLKCFRTFHHYFNLLWLGFPKRCFPSAVRAMQVLLDSQPNPEQLSQREDACEYIRRATEAMRLQGHTDSDIQGHNLVFLHVNHNTYRLAFWAIYHVLSNPECYKALKAEINEAVAKETNPETGVANFTLSDVKEMPVLGSVVNETCRLSCGVFVVRYVMEDTQFTMDDGKTYLVRKDDRIAVYPPTIHKDGDIFEDPLVFKYDRFIGRKFYTKDGREVKSPLLQFGFLCPGKHYALLKLKWYLFSTFYHMDLRLEGKQTAEYAYQYHGHEIIPWQQDVDISYRLQPSTVHLTLT